MQMPQQKEKNGWSWLFLPRVVFGMFFPRVFPRLPAFQTSTTAETQHLVSCACKDTHSLNLLAFIAMIKYLIKYWITQSFEIAQCFFSPKTMFPLVRHLCSTCAVQASSGKPLVVYRVPDTCKATKPLLKTPHRDMRVCIACTAELLLFCTSLERDVAHIVPEDEEAVGKMVGMFPPGVVPCFPATQHATTAETLHLVSLS